MNNSLFSLFPPATPFVFHSRGSRRRRRSDSRDRRRSDSRDGRRRQPDSAREDDSAVAVAHATSALEDAKRTVEAAVAARIETEVAAKVAAEVAAYVASEAFGRTVEAMKRAERERALAAVAAEVAAEVAAAVEQVAAARASEEAHRKEEEARAIAAKVYTTNIHTASRLNHNATPRGKAREREKTWPILVMIEIHDLVSF